MDDPGKGQDWLFPHKCKSVFQLKHDMHNPQKTNKNKTKQNLIKLSECPENSLSQHFTPMYDLSTLHSNYQRMSKSTLLPQHPSPNNG